MDASPIVDWSISLHENLAPKEFAALRDTDESWQIVDGDTDVDFKTIPMTSDSRQCSWCNFKRVCFPKGESDR